MIIPSSVALFMCVNDGNDGHFRIVIDRDELDKQPMHKALHRHNNFIVPTIRILFAFFDDLADFAASCNETTKQ